jgi:hypothetical protein
MLRCRPLCCRRYDEHLTIRETKNRFVHKQMDIHDAGGVKMMGVTTKF